MKIGLCSFPTLNPPPNPAVIDPTYLSQFISNHSDFKMLHWDHTGLIAIIFYNSLGHFYLPLTVSKSLPLRLLQGLLPYSSSPSPCLNGTFLQRPSKTTLSKTAAPLILRFSMMLYFSSKHLLGTQFTWFICLCIYCLSHHWNISSGICINHRSSPST